MTVYGMTFEGEKEMEEGSGEGSEVKRSNMMQKFVTALHSSHIAPHERHVPFVSYRFQ